MQMRVNKTFQNHANHLTENIISSKKENLQLNAGLSD